MTENTQTVRLNFQQVVLMLQQERASLEAVQIRTENFRRMLEDTLIAKEAIDAIQKTSKDQKLMVSLGAGVYCDATLENNNEVKVTLAGGVIKNASIPEALGALNDRQKEAETELKKLSEDQGKLMTNLNSLTQLARQLGGQKRDQPQ